MEGSCDFQFYFLLILANKIRKPFALFNEFPFFKWFVRTEGRQIESVMALDLNIIPAVTAMRQGERAGGGDRAPGPAHPRLPGEDQHHLDDQHLIFNSPQFFLELTFYFLVPGYYPEVNLD